VKMKIINQTGKKLPNTGSAGKPVLLTGILAVGIMAMIYRKKEQKR
jgi:LPXTG-motif cell wall-anchored protein